MMTNKSSPDKKQKTPERSNISPIKVKDYFTNPLHKIKQPAFTEIGFTVSALNTFVKNFTYRNNSKYINFQQIKSYIKKFTNNNSKLMQMYQEFFLKNFKIKDGLIDGEQFVQFFVKESKHDDANLRKIYNDISPFNVQNLVKKAQYLQVPLSSYQSKKIVKMINYTYGGKGDVVTYEHFQSALKSN